MVKEIKKEFYKDHGFVATFVFPESWKAREEIADTDKCDEDIIQWALKHQLQTEKITRKACAAVAPKQSQQMLFPSWNNDILQKCKTSTAKYWLWIFLLDDLLEKSTREEINELSLQFVARETSNAFIDHNDNASTDSVIDSFISAYTRAYTEIVDDFSDDLLQLHPDATAEDLFEWRKRLAMGQLQFFYSTAEEVNKINNVSTESDYLVYRSLGSAVAVYCLFVEAKNGILNVHEHPKEFVFRLNQIYSVLSCFIGLVNDGFSYHREKDMKQVFNIVKFWQDHGYVKSTEDGYKRLNVLLNHAYTFSEQLLTSFLADYSYITGVAEHIKDLRYGAVGFVNIHRNLKRYRDGAFTAHITFVEGNYKQERTEADDLPELRNIFNLTDVQSLWGNINKTTDSAGQNKTEADLILTDYLEQHIR